MVQSGPDLSTANIIGASVVAVDDGSVFGGCGKIRVLHRHT